MSSVKSCLVQDRMSAEFSTDILHRKSFDVNMRLFRSNSSYRSVVLSIVKYMGSLVDKEYSDYSKLSGISGANIGIPLNIIGFRSKADTTVAGLPLTKGTFFFMINPSIVWKSEETSVTSSNCGSLRLPKDIKVERANEVEVSFYDISGKQYRGKFTGPAAFTIQHEVEHNLGILITDKEVKS